MAYLQRQKTEMNRLAAKKSITAKTKTRPSIRRAKELSQVAYDKNWIRNNQNVPLYYMHRGLNRINGWRYDMTIIPPMILGEEFVKTQGHRHQRKNKEIYTVLEGKAIYLLQKAKDGRITDIWAVVASKGETVVIPAGCDHITINPTRKVLKMVNWIPENCQSDYSFLGKNKGAGYYYLQSGWLKNENYKAVPKLKFKKPLKRFPEEMLNKTRSPKHE